MIVAIFIVVCRTCKARGKFAMQFYIDIFQDYFRHPDIYTLPQKCYLGLPMCNWLGKTVRDRRLGLSYQCKLLVLKIVKK